MDSSIGEITSIQTVAMVLLQQIRCGQVRDLGQRNGALGRALGVRAGDLVGPLGNLELHVGAHALQKKKRRRNMSMVTN